MNNAFPLAALGIALGIIFGYVNPAWSGSIADTKAAIARSDEALQAADRYATQQNELASLRNAIDPEMLRRLEVLLPDSVDNVSLILDLNALATRSGVLLSNIDVTREEGDAEAVVQPIGSLELSLTAVGSYNAFKNFLEGVERSARLLDVRDIRVSGSDTGTYEFEVTLRLYWLK